MAHLPRRRIGAGGHALWDPEGHFPNTVWSGTLVLDGPCAYLDVSHQDGAPVFGGEPLRSFVRLPEPLTRHDSATDETWVGENGPELVRSHGTTRPVGGLKLAAGLPAPPDIHHSTCGRTEARRVAR